MPTILDEVNSLEIFPYEEKYQIGIYGNHKQGQHQPVNGMLSILEAIPEAISSEHQPMSQ